MKKGMFSLISDIEKFTLDNNLAYIKFTEAEYLYVHQMNNKPKCKECSINETRFDGIHKGYSPFCSRDCANCNEESKRNSDATNLRLYGVKKFLSSKKVRKQIAETNVEIYGIDNPLKSKEIQEQIVKTNIERYGFDNPIKNKEIKEKARDTLFKNYGVRDPFSSEEIRDRAKETMIEKYGVEIPMHNEKIKEKSKNTCEQRYGVSAYLASTDRTVKYKNLNLIKKLKIINGYLDKNNLKFINYDKDKNTVDCSCLACNNEFNLAFCTLYSKTKRNRNICPICYPYISPGFSESEKELLEFIKENYNGIIKTNTVSLIAPYELDIYLPDLKLAFEYDGLYWHSDEYKFREYHLMKTERCKELGIKLIHLTDNDWINKKEIVKSMILNYLHAYNKVINVKDCIIKKVSRTISKKFINENNIEKYILSKVNYGLYRSNELISLMSFGYKCKFKNPDIEVLRFCNKIYYNVVGAENKLFCHFIKENPKINKIKIKYNKYYGIDNKIEKLNHLNDSKIDYFWINRDNILESMKYNKRKLIKSGWLLPNETESDCMYRLGYNKFYDCGSMVFEWNRPIA